jgi:FSR family fosmidomycin resistance protein-like MFS transporter
MSTKVTQAAEKTLYSVLVAIAAAHFLNDWIQALVPSMYPIFKDEYHLSFSQIGWLTFVFQCTASLLQPLIGFYTDKYPKPFSQVIGMFFSLSGIVMLAYTHSYGGLLLAVSLIGMGSAVFHPESARVSFIAAGKRRGLAQSIFQIGGNLGTAFGPLTIAWFVVGHGQRQVLIFIWVALAGMALLTRIAFWYRHHIVRNTIQQRSVQFEHHLSKKQVKGAVLLLLVIIFSKFFYTASISSYYTFYLMDQFSLTIQQAQFHLFLYLAAYAVGTMLGGPLGDKFGRKWVIGFSVFGAAPFTLLLPYVNLFWTDALMIGIGLIISSAFPAILVYAQELMPKKLGMVSGLFYGLAFGMAAMGSAIMGHLADLYSIEMVYRMAAFFPLIGGVFYFLPNLKAAKKEVTTA